MPDAPSIFALIHDLNCADPDEMLIPEIAERVRYLKYTEEGNKEVSDYINNLIDEEVHAAVEDITIKLIRVGKMSLEEIADCVGLPLSEVQELADSANP